MNLKADVMAWLLAVLSLIIIGICVIIDRTVPSELWMAFFGTAGIGAGVNIPKITKDGQV